MQRVIALDGPSGVGKSSVSRRLAALLKWTYLDTGAMYRAVTLAWLRAGRKEGLLTDGEWSAGLDLDIQESSILLDGEDVSQQIREPEVTANASAVSAVPAVRGRLTAMQRRIGNARPCIMDGRDIGTVVFPNAFLKVFMTASAAVRGERRWLQMGGEASGLSLEQVIADQKARDEKDSARAVAPLKPAADAWHLDTGPLSEDEVVDAIHRECRKRLAKME